VSRPSTRTVLACFALTALASTSAASSTGPVDRSKQREVVRILRTLRDPDHAPIAELAPGFTRVSRHMPEYLFEMLETGVVPDEGEGEQLLSIYQRELILAAYAEMGRSAALGKLRTAMQAEELSARQASVFVYSAVGSDEDLSRVFEFALVDPEVERLGAAMTEAVRLAATSILAREPSGGFRWIERNWRNLEEPLLIELVMAVGDTRDPRGLELLAEVMLWREELVGVAIAQVRKLGRALDEGLNDEIATSLRLQLDGEPPNIRAACHAIASLRDLESIPILIELLEHEERGVGDAAHSALRSMTEMAFPAVPRLWSHWYTEEQRWDFRQKQRAFDELLSRDLELVERAAAEIRRHPLAHDDLTAAVPRLLASPRPEIAQYGCKLALELGELRTVPFLIDSIQEDGGELGEEAWQTARALTGWDLPRDFNVWRERWRRETS
jgi:hypothetical protein